MDTTQPTNESEKKLRNGSPEFYKLLEEMADTHDKKSHDYASNDNPFANYHFAGMLSKLFNNTDDAGFIGRIGEKLYRLANIENSGKTVLNESIEDTEKDICVIIALWIASRRERRKVYSYKVTPQVESRAIQKVVTKYFCLFCRREFTHQSRRIELKNGGIAHFCSELCEKIYVR